jgi:hypothetical protein
MQYILFYSAITFLNTLIQAKQMVSLLVDNANEYMACNTCVITACTQHILLALA